MRPKQLVLLGAGHTNALILRRWASNPIAGVELKCISDQAFATYSGMLPAVLCGQLPEDAMRLDLAPLCARSNARLVIGRVASLDRAGQQLVLENGSAIPFDVLSIGIGSTTRDPPGATSETYVGVKPMQDFPNRLRLAVDHATAGASSRELEIVIIGGGIAGIEIAFCLAPFLRSCGVGKHSLRIVYRDQVAAGVSPSLRARIVHELTQRGIDQQVGSVNDVTHRTLELDGGASVEAAIVIGATGATAPALLSCLNLPTAADGFLAVDDKLQSTSGDPIFVVGDSGTRLSSPHPKAGVYAVRQAPVLWDNIHRLLTGHRLRAYRPQTSFMKLINLGDGRAVGQWRGMIAQGRWVLALKHWIDERFMAQFRP